MMNIDALLTPLSETAPSGDDLSFSADFDDIAELRREEDASLDQGEWVRPVKSADWAAVQARCGELLATRSKDLRLAMWYAEAAAVTRGFAGLHDGLVLCTRLSEGFWASLHPQPEDDDMEQRVGNIAWLLGRVGGLVQTAPITAGRDGSFSLQQLQSARALQAAIDRNPDKPPAVPADAVTLERFQRALKSTPADTLRARAASLQGCREALVEWQRGIDARLGAQGPSFVAAREAIDTAMHDLQRLSKDSGVVVAAPSPSFAVAVPAPTAPGAVQGDMSGPITSRAQALAQLRQVANYFRGTEPHSPVAYLAEKAVRWGDMPLHEWLRAVVKDPNALAHLEDLLGTPPDAAAAGAGA